MSEEIGGEIVPDSTRDLDIDGELDLMIEDLDLWYRFKSGALRRFASHWQEQRYGSSARPAAAKAPCCAPSTA